MPPANNNNNPQPYTSLFLGAPFAKFSAATTVISYLSVNTKRAAVAMMEFDAARIRGRGESYRYLTSKLTFGSTSELVVGTMLLTYLMRKFEREMGSRKMVFFSGFITLSTIAVESFLVSSSPSSLLSFNLHYAGPYALIGALFSLYHRYTPRLHPRFFSVLGINFSEKIFQYVWLAQVASSNGWNSVYAVGIGWFMALVYDLAPLFKKLDVPDAVADLVGDLSTRLLEAPPRMLVPPPARGGRAFAPRAAPAAGAAGGVRPTAAAQRPPVAADPNAVEQLVNMGFSRAQVIEALQSTNNDIQRAADRLLMGAQ